MADIFAVIWCDLVPLSLKCEDAASAIDKAQEMHARSVIAGVELHELRAVRLPDAADHLETLWEPAHV